MSGTPLNPARLAGLMATVAKSFPLELLTDEVCQSWEDNGAEAARRLVFFATMAPPPKRKGKTPEVAMVNPAEVFVTSEKLYVDPDFIARVDLSPVPDDTRKLSFICPPLPRRMNDTAIDIHAGGKGTLRRKRATIAQFKREVELAVTGDDSIFKKGGYYLLYLEVRGDLYPVYVCWSDEPLNLNCYRFDEGGGWHEGNQVCGN